MKLVDVVKGPDGPILPPLRAGLPYTSAERCRELILAVIAQAVADDEREWAASVECGAYCRLIGLSSPTILKLRVWWLLGLTPRFVHPKVLHADRWDEDDRPAGDRWQAWPH